MADEEPNPEESPLFKARRTKSLERIGTLRSTLDDSLVDADAQDTDPKVCIYATGSLARMEASLSSDLDAFFFLTGNSESTPFSKIREVKILNSVLEASEAAGFPDFSNDGEYLEFMHIEDVLANIGGREDDYHNMFTARMLLILESKYLLNEDVFNSCRKVVVDRYFKDFHDHSTDFRPIFLLNDILRFWRTLCLNYEHGRHWRGSEDEMERAKGHLSNLKLRFSRLNICFSFIASLLSQGGAMEPGDVLSVCEQTPIERLAGLRGKSMSIDKAVSTLLTEYEWFLEQTGDEKSMVLGWISDESNRVEAFGHSEEFTKAMYNLVHEVAQEDHYLRYLVI